MRSTTALRISSTPSPVFPEAGNTSDSGHPSNNESSLVMSATLAFCESILETTGIIASPKLLATERTESVCASTPCVASTSRTTPSTAESARDTS